jgi:N-hydroxyarylamine O-acetyltransferase
MYTPLTTTELARYFGRIGFSGPATRELSTLQALHKLHVMAIPFENLDSWLGTVPSLREETVFDKLVVQGRGGYCFEQNQLFMRVLLSLGFEVQALSARVHVPGLQLPRNHLVLLVSLAEGQYLADVGFGGIALTAPLALDCREAQQAMHERWRLEQGGWSGSYVLSAAVAGQWEAKYSFALEPQLAADLEMANWFVATHHESLFVKTLVAARVDAAGRHALFDTRYTRYYPGEPPLSVDIASPQTLLNILQEAFGIDTAGIPELERRLQILCGVGSEQKAA